MSDLIGNLHRKGKFYEENDELLNMPIDPTLASCCAREIESNRKANRIDEILHRHDRIARIEQIKKRMERHTLDLSFGKGCRCSYDPNMDGGEYAALIELRKDRADSHSVKESQRDAERDQENKNDTNGESSSDSDDEFDYLLDEDLPGIDEEYRLRELEEAALYRTALENHGFGMHRQIHPQRVLRAATMRNLGGQNYSPSVVHLFHAHSKQCAQLDMVLEQLAQKYRGTRFLRADGIAVIQVDSKVCEYLELRIDDVPSLITFVDGKMKVPAQSVHSFTDKNRNEVVPEMVEQWLHYARVLQYEAPPLNELCRLRPEEEAFLDIGTQPESHEESEHIYNCGIEGCCKKFAHKHVGVKTDEQSGLLLCGEIIE